MTELFDIGVNLTAAAFASDRDAVLARAVAAGVTQLMLTGSDLKSSAAALALCANQTAQLACCVGIHPHHSGSVDPDFIERLRALAANPYVRAIGEIGLDFFRDIAPREAQHAVFAAQLELATALRLPVFVHDRDSAGEVADVLREHRAQLPDVVVHCFTGDGAQLDALLALDCHIGITGWVCDERRGTALATLVPRIPADRLLLETDAPYLVPRSLHRRPQRNEPALLVEVARVVAGLRSCSVDALIEQTSTNARRFFRWEARPA